MMLGAWFLVLGACAANFTIAERGQASDWEVVTPAKPAPTEEYAAEEFVRWTKELTGVTLPIAKGRKTKAHALVLRAPEPELSLGEDGFNLRAEGGDVVVRGGLRGIIYGVYELLENYGGIGWFAPDCTELPTNGVFRIPDALYDTQKPAFLLRDTCWFRALDTENQYAVVAANRDFGVRKRFNGEYSARARPNQGGIAARFAHGAGIAHTFLRLVPPKRYFKDHPEYYSEINGVRRSGETQLCLTNPEVLEVLVSNLVAVVDKDPEAPFYGVSQDDWFGYCECTKCRAVDEAEGSHAGTVIRFVNAVAARMDQLRPGRTCETLAYQYTRTPPKITRPASNVVVCLCNIECDWSRPLAAGVPACNAAFAQDLAAWSRITGGLFAWDYDTNYKWFAHPFPNTPALQANLKFFRDHGVKWVFEQGGSRNASFAALKCHLTSKWLWNPDLPAAPLLDAFFRGYYGAGASYARACFDAYEEALARAPEAVRTLRLYEGDRPEVYSDALLEKCLGLWRQAEAAVADDPVRRANVRQGLAHVIAQRLDRAAARTKFAWATREPARFADGAALAADQAWIMDWIAERRRMDPRHGVYFAERDTGRDVRVTNAWARAAAVRRPPTGGDTATLTADDFTVDHEGTWARVEADAAAVGGRAVKVTTIQDLPAVHFAMGNVAYDDVDYELRVHVRVARVAGGKGEAFRAAVEGTKAEVAPRVETLADDGYAWYSLGRFRPRDNSRFTFGMGRFKNGGGQNAVKAVWIDQVEIRRAE